MYNAKMLSKTTLALREITMSHSKIDLEFKTSLNPTDYGLIIGCDGNLKGIWVPETMSGMEIPEGIVNMCVEKFGIDPNGEGHYSVQI